MSIFKATYTYTFMFDSNVNTVDEVNAMSLGDVIYHCEHEHMLGRETLGPDEIVELPNEQVPTEEIALGCDGSFFADPDELEHARMNGELDD